MVKVVHFVCFVLLLSSSVIEAKLLVGKIADKVKDKVKGLIDDIPTLPQKKCFDKLGCFGTMDFFELFNRPLTFLPDTPEEMDVKFLLFTKDNPTRPVRLAYDSEPSLMSQSGFDPAKETKFIVHGWRDNFDEMEWMGDTKDLFLKKAKNGVNVIAVDWSGGSKVVNYAKAASNTRVVGAQIAYFIQGLKNATGADPTKMHLFGHSLGAHVCGFAGERIRDPKLARITGIDPAGPYYRTKQSTSRLHPEDADFVDAIHTDGGDFVLNGYGLSSPVGLVDIYPNGGSTQPGCESTKAPSNILEQGLIGGITETDACNHRRVTKIIKTDFEIEDGCQPVAYECEDYDSFMDGKCGSCGDDNSGCRLMGYWPQYRHKRPSGSVGKKYYLQTSDSAPYCVHHYQIIVHLARDSETSAGIITLDLSGEARDVNGVALSQKWTLFKPGSQNHYLLTYRKPLGPVVNATIHWKSSLISDIPSGLLLGKKPVISVEKVEVNYMSHFDPKQRSANSTVLCPTGSNLITNKESATFSLC